MISYERLVEIVHEAERVRCDQLYQRFDGECERITNGCKKCTMNALDISKEEYNELFKDFI